MLAQAGLIGAALMLGLAGSAHCVAMCGAPAAGVIRLVRAQAGGATAALHTSHELRGHGLFHLGRLSAYALAGASVAALAQSLHLAGTHVGALKPLSVLLQAAVLAWGVALLATGRQPAWTHGMGQRLLARLRHAPGRNALLAGAAWVFMPCGLLYSALALASLGNGPLQGAAVMLAFGAVSGGALAAAQWLWRSLRFRAAPRHERLPARLGGALLVALALHALWVALGERIAQWCA